MGLALKFRRFSISGASESESRSFQPGGVAIFNFFKKRRQHFLLVGVLVPEVKRIFSFFLKKSYFHLIVAVLLFPAFGEQVQFQRRR